MMKMITALLLIAVIAFGVELKVDEKASNIKFEATKMMFIGVDGNFSDFSGSIEVEGSDIVSINGVLRVLSIDTDNEERDDHLLSSDFFDETHFGHIVFKSTKIEDGKVTANITIKDITKPVVFEMEELYVSTKSVKIKLSAVVDRTEFDIDNNFMSMMIFDNVDVSSYLEAH